MNVAGIDFSSHAVDVVTVPMDAGAPVWTRYELHGHDAFDRARSVTNSMPGPTSVLWDDVLAVGIEHPAGRHGVGPLLRIQGAVLSRIPARMLVVPLPPGKWRKLVGLAGNASKTDVRRFAMERRGVHIDGRFLDYSPGWLMAYDGTTLEDWPFDATDAHCIALATRTLLAQQQKDAA